MITERDMGILCAVARYYVVSRAHVQRLCFPEDRTGRATRRRLQVLVRSGLINRVRTPLFNPGGGSAWPAYFPSRRGIEVLAEHFDDESFLALPTRSPEPLYLLHWLAMTDTHIVLDQAIARQNAVRLEGWLSEWDVVNREETQPEKRYRLYTLLRERARLVCVPDAAFLLGMGQHRKVFYLEQDRATTGVRQVAARKTPGYAELSKRGWHKRHFPQATVPGFSVLLIAPTSRRRDALRKAIKEKQGADLWKFATQSELTPESFLFGPVFFPCEGDPVALVKRVEAPRADKNTSTSLKNAERQTCEVTLEGQERQKSANSASLTKTTNSQQRTETSNSQERKVSGAEVAVAQRIGRRADPSVDPGQTRPVLRRVPLDGQRRAAPVSSRPPPR